MVKCPVCGEEVEFFYKKGKYDPYLRCPKCGNLFTKKDLPPGEAYEVRYMSQESEERHEEVRTEEKGKKVSLFEEPKEPTEIIAEILLDWGCEEEFVRKITEYINMKGYFDPGWLMNMLLRAKTGRRFTEQEAYMVVDMITAALEREKQKMESAGKIFPFAIMSLKPSPVTGQMSGMYTQPYTLQPQPPATLQYLSHQLPPIQYQQPSAATLPAQTSYPQATMRPEDIARLVEEKLRTALQEKRTADTIEEIKKAIADYEKKLIELRHEQEKRTDDVKKELTSMVQQTIKELLEELRASLTPPQPVKSEEEVTKKDLEIMFEKLKREEMEKRYELEKKLLEDKLQVLLDKIESNKSAPVSPEGWQKDETRLIAELGSRFFDIVKDRKPIEYIVRILPVPQQTQQPQTQQPQKTEKTLLDLIKESGGEVE